MRPPFLSNRTLPQHAVRLALWRELPFDFDFAAQRHTRIWRTYNAKHTGIVIQAGMQHVALVHVGNRGRFRNNWPVVTTRWKPSRTGR